MLSFVHTRLFNMHMCEIIYHYNFCVCGREKKFVELNYFVWKCVGGELKLVQHVIYACVCTMYIFVISFIYMKIRNFSWRSEILSFLFVGVAKVEKLVLTLHVSVRVPCVAVRCHVEIMYGSVNYSKFVSDLHTINLYKSC